MSGSDPASVWTRVLLSRSSFPNLPFIRRRLLVVTVGLKMATSLLRNFYLKSGGCEAERCPCPRTTQ